MEWNLVVAKGEFKGMNVPIRVSPFVFGRDDACQLRPASRYVSHRHCLLIRRGNALVLRDCHSTNGTFVNARKVGEVELRPGDRVGIGPLAFLVSPRGPAPINHKPRKSSPRRVRTLSEDAIAALLLESNKEVAGVEPEVDRMSKPDSSFSVADGDTSKAPESKSPEVAQGKAPLSPAEVAAAILRKKSVAWLHRQKSWTSVCSKESAPN